jgi:hypothetical protein
MKRTLFFCIVFLAAGPLAAQVNIISTNPLAEQILLGNYNPSAYLASTILDHPDTISRGINTRVSPDSLKSSIIRLASFRNRNMGADTNSPVYGMGAARRWVMSKFQEYSAQNENRLIASYLQFDTTVCGRRLHKMPYAVLPGMDTTDKSVIIVEGHMDSRCEGLCDTSCIARGVEDNASGTALVLELARVMSRYSYHHTIVFIVTIGEEQGLFGASAFAMYAMQKGIPIKLVQNNDVVGGIICGVTSSPPSCPGVNNIDSTHVRFFSYGGYNSPHKGLARFMKLEYQEQLLPHVSVPMTINIMTPEDRTGRSGDHVPFRNLGGFTAMRVTSANEHGDANVSNPNYTDRQHSVRDTLGADTDNDQVVDSFFVDFDYLARNAVINGNSMGLAGVGPKTPDCQVNDVYQSKIRVQITQQTQYNKYRVGVRTQTNDWDSVFTMTGVLVDTFAMPPSSVYFISVMSVDSNGLESLPSREYMLHPTGISELPVVNGLELLQNKPNPFDEATTIGVLVKSAQYYKEAFITVKDISGREVTRIPVRLDPGLNEVYFTHGYHATGSYFYSLVVDGQVISSREMVFAN